jgi:lipopolysaccharide/colanic/teichoic acid biosynthesis glycosyltransferase
MTQGIKRLFDLAAASLALIFFAPLMTLVALAIRMMMGSPVFFRQVRPGYRMKPFVLYKFRTMCEACNADGTPRPDAERLTRLGGLLRRASLDELPQLWNVLRGDLSLVGPRPLLMQYLPLYTPEQARRHAVRPGITGWAQVNGRNAISWKQKLDLDIWYVNHWTLWLDIKILAMTVLKVFNMEGISGNGEATVAPFTGTDKGEQCNRSGSLVQVVMPRS